MTRVEIFTSRFSSEILKEIFTLEEINELIADAITFIDYANNIINDELTHLIGFTPRQMKRNITDAKDFITKGTKIINNNLITSLNSFTFYHN